MPSPLLTVILAGTPPNVLESAPYWVLLVEEYSPIAAAAIAVVVLARTGFTKKLAEYRRDTLDLVRLRAETLEKELAASQTEIQELQREVRSRDRRIEMLEDDIETLQQGRGRRPYPHQAPHQAPHPPLHTEPPTPPHAPDVDDKRPER